MKQLPDGSTAPASIVPDLVRELRVSRALLMELNKQPLQRPLHNSIEMRVRQIDRAIANAAAHDAEASHA